MFKMYNVSAVQAQNMPNAPPELLVIHEKISGIELRGGMIWMRLFILQQLH